MFIYFCFILIYFNSVFEEVSVLLHLWMSPTTVSSLTTCSIFSVLDDMSITSFCSLVQVVDACKTTPFFLIFSSDNLFTFTWAPLMKSENAKDDGRFLLLSENGRENKTKMLHLSKLANMYHIWKCLFEIYLKICLLVINRLKRISLRTLDQLSHIYG